MSDLTNLIAQIHDAANDITDMLAAHELPDPSTVYIEPDPGDQNPLNWRGPSINLGCTTHGTLIHFAWGGGGRVTLPDLLAQARQHLDDFHH